jgi:hypothetical protein
VGNFPKPTTKLYNAKHTRVPEERERGD